MFDQLPERDRVLMQSLLKMDPLERLGQVLYQEEDGRILQPIRSKEERQAALQMMQDFGIDCHADSEGALLQNGLFTPVRKEQDSIRPSYDISVGLHPRFLGNAPHTHDYFELNYVCSGTMTQVIGERRLTLQDGDLMAICPNVPHDVLSLDAGNIMLTIRIRRSTFYRTFFSLFTEGDVFYEYFHNILYRNQSAPFLLFRTGADADILHLCLEMYQESDAPREYSSRYRNLLMSEIFLRLLRDHCDQLQIGTMDEKENAPVALMLQYISSNCKDVTLSEMAERFHYNTTYLSRLLKDAVGRSFLDLRAEMRMEKARKMLETTDCAPAQIAELVGYQNVSHFYKAFRASSGVSPKEYREQIKEQNQ